MKKTSAFFFLVAGIACGPGVFGCGETKTVVIEKPDVPAVVVPAKEKTIVALTPMEVRVINISRPRLRDQ